ncbi:MAG: AAA family ATPase [Gemmatimonadaceae bacterium]
MTGLRMRGSFVWRGPSTTRILARPAYTTVNGSVISFCRNEKRRTDPLPMSRQYALFSLGELRLIDPDGRTISRRRKPLVVLAYLCRKAPRAVSRAELVELLWGEREEAKARQSLRQALLELKRLLGDAIAIGQDSVSLSGDDVELDLIALERDEAAGRDRAAIDRFAGDFLVAADDTADSSLRVWIDTERAALRRRLGIVFERLLDETERRGDWRDAVTIAGRWCDVAPLDERAATRLIGALRLSGRPVDALAAHASFVERIREALDVKPSIHFRALATELDHAALHATAEPQAASTLLPFVGRDDAFASLTSAWSATLPGRVTLALVEGSAGMGASRLCAELARWVRDAHPGAYVSSADLRAVARAEGDSAYAAARALLANVAQAPALGGVSPASLRVLHALVPAIAERFPRIARPDEPPSAPEVRDAVHEFLLALADDGPVLLIADGVAGADAPSLSLLRSIATLRHAPMMLVLADRSLDIDREDALAALRDDTAVAHVMLAPLFAADVALLLERDAALAARALADAGGVPTLVSAQLDTMLAEHLVTAGASGGRIASPAIEGRPLAMPPVARAMAREAVRTLDETSRRVADAFAVFGAPLAIADAARLAGAPTETTERVAAHLVRAGVARSAPDDPRTVEMHPPVVARASYDLVPVLRREAMHGAATALLAAAGRPGADRARARHHEERAGGTIAPLAHATLRRRAISVLATAAAVVMVAAVLATRRGPAVRPRTVAVFPFTVRAGPELGFLRAGMVDLLSTSLDGAAGLRTIDPRSVLAAIGGRDQPLPPDAARQIAARLGASYFVVGDAVGAHGQLQLGATLYTVGTDSGALVHARSDGREEDLFGVVDRLTAQLAVSQGATSRGPSMRLGALTTSSLEALKAYLDGEALYRVNDMPAAMSSFKRATTLDSSFALAWYGLASGASWMLQSKEEQRAAAEAVRTSGRLSERNRTLVEAFAALSRGAVDSAERLAASVAEKYDDIDAWVILGEALYHHNFKRGRSIVESRRAWEQVLASDPRHWPALQHLSEVAAIEGKRAESDSLFLRYESIVGVEHTLPPSNAVHRFEFGQQRDRDEVVAHMTGDRGFWLIASVWYVSVFGRDVDGARRLARILVDPIRPPEQQGMGRVLLAHLDVASGKWREARAELAIAGAHSPGDATEHETLLSLAPFLTDLTASTAVQRELLRRLSAESPAPAGAVPWPTPDAPLRPLLHAYLRGLIGVRLRDENTVARSLREIDSLPDPSGSIAIAQGLRYAVRAAQARARGSPAEALADLERSARATPFVAAWTSAFISQARERYERAELLNEAGRDDEALRWYATFDQNSPYDLVYLAPALYRQGQIHERRGRARLASDRYQRFIALWRECDPELHPLVADAERRLAGLAAAAAK